MRRIIIVFFWLFKSKNNVSLIELLRFITKPKVKDLGSRYVKSIKKVNEYHQIEFYPIPNVLYWPNACAMDGLYQVASETFDSTDWHFYQKENTQIKNNDILLDIGTAEGLFALRVVSTCRKIIMIEPNDHFYHALKKTFSSFHEKVDIHNIAVGNEEGEIYFDPDSLSGKVIHNENGGKLKRITRIDKLIPPQTRITYLKADLEGYELQMLKGARDLIQTNKPTIAITSYHTENNANEIIDFIKSIVPEYKVITKGIFHISGKPVMIHFWI